MKPRAEWWPQDPDGPLPPLWFYILRNWVWLLVVAVECVLMVVLVAVDAPETWRWILTCTIWFGLGVQTRGIWERHRQLKRAVPPWA